MEATSPAQTTDIDLETATVAASNAASSGSKLSGGMWFMSMITVSEPISVDVTLI